MKICSVKGCNKKHYGLGYCNKHYNQYKYYGGIKKRTKFDPNEYYFCHGIVYIYLYNAKNEHIASAIIDREDFDKVKDHKWGLNSEGYVVSRIDKKMVLLHRFLLDCSRNKEADHINHNTINNSRNNLRICTRSQNNMNREFKGMSYNKRENKWMARIKIDGKQIFLGYFDTEEEALKVRRKAEKKYFGDYAYKGERNDK